MLVRRDRVKLPLTYSICSFTIVFFLLFSSCKIKNVGTVVRGCRNRSHRYVNALFKCVLVGVLTEYCLLFLQVSTTEMSRKSSNVP